MHVDKAVKTEIYYINVLRSFGDKSKIFEVDEKEKIKEPSNNGRHTPSVCGCGKPASSAAEGEADGP